MAGGWDLPSHQVMNLGTTPLQPLRCCLAKGGRLWVGYWNRVHVVDIESKKAEVSESKQCVNICLSQWVNHCCTLIFIVRQEYTLIVVLISGLSIAVLLSPRAAKLLGL